MIQERTDQLKQAMPSLVEHEPLSKHVNFRIGGPARWYVVAKTGDEIVAAVEAAKRLEIPWEILGGGSNVLVSDKGFDGLIIQSGNREIAVDGARVTCGAGAITAMVARKAAEAGLRGFEWAVTVPGTIGGAAFGNAGCYGSEMKDVVASVDAYRVSDGQRVQLSAEACRFGYRDSFFKHERHLILSVTLELAPGDPQASRGLMDELIAKRKTSQPFENASAGCLFKNATFGDVSEIASLRDEVDVPQAFIDAKSIPAGWLVERAGFKGFRLGNVEVSPKHANFLVNLGGATADEVAQVVSMVEMKVRDAYGIMLKTEVQFVGF